MRLTDEKIQRTTTVLCYVFCILAAITFILGIALLFSGGCSENGCSAARPQEDGTDVNGSDQTTPVVNPGEDPTLPQTEDAGIAYQDKLIFVGDSLTAHLISRGVLTDGTNTKQVWRTTSNMMNLNADINNVQIALPGTGKMMTIADAAAEVTPAVMIITLGTDYGVSFLTEQEFKSCYAKLIRAIQEKSPATQIILQSIFPVTAGCSVLTNEKINKCNAWVKAIAVENGCRYLDTQSVLKDNKGNLKDEYSVSTDGIHLTADAYKVILQYIRTHAINQ